MSLINREALYEKACDLEAQALSYIAKIANDKTKIEEWKIWSAILIERTGFKHDIFDALEVLPEQHWTPVSERLPEAKEKHYWVCTDTGYQYQCRWTNINHIWTDLTTEWHWHIMDTPQYSKVIAWMPLPEPYREEGENE